MNGLWVILIPFALAGIAFGVIVGRKSAATEVKLMRRQWVELSEAVADEDAGWMAWIQATSNYVSYTAVREWTVQAGGQNYKGDTLLLALKKARHGERAMRQMNEELKELSA